MSTATERDRLATAVETARLALEREHGAHNAPIGGWRNRAVEAVADREGMNPYALDHIIRGLRDA